MKIRKCAMALPAALWLTVASPLVQADEGFLIDPAMGKINIDARLRYEDVDDNSALKDSDALTLRVRLGYLTPNFSGFKAFAEVESTTPLGDRDYIDGRGHGTDSPIIDPDNNELNRAWLAYSGFDSTLIKLGRQRIVLDNSRFIGNVGWRQNEQTFDALTLVNNSVADTQIILSYVNDVKTIKGTHVEADVPVFNIKYSGLSFGDITAYGYFIDFDASAATDLDTIGLRFNGSTQISNDLNVLYTAEYAEQNADIVGASDEDLSYYLIEGGVKFSGITAKLSHEVHEAHNNVAFQTPLGTNHAFNGWADQFLATPADGLEDTFLTISTHVAGVKLMAVYHDFEAENSGTDYGDEIDLLAVKKFNKHYKVLVKYAAYDRGDSISGKADKDKFWIQGELSF
ncbi:MAG: hypothetical protein COB26_01125 [Piscirickettsiaceae bacterium]|nr:MAG: hypothetical protein COB26_01125 [Piscirickettsiaceae bacterium]